MKISVSKFHLVIAILGNVGLGLWLCFMALSHHVHDHYYREFTGMILQSSHDQILRGNFPQVLKILEEIPWRPESKDLSQALSKFGDMAAASIEAGQKGKADLPPSSP